MDILDGYRLLIGELLLPTFLNEEIMKKKDLLNIVSNQDIIRLINFDDDFLTVARSYHSDYIAWKQYDNKEYYEDFDINFISRFYDEIVLLYRSVKGGT